MKEINVKTSEILAAYNVLNGAKFGSLDDADKVKHGRLRTESPIDGEKVVDAKGDEIARNERHLIGRKETHDIEYSSIYQSTGSTNDTKADELLCLFLPKESLYLFYQHHRIAETNLLIPLEFREAQADNAEEGLAENTSGHLAGSQFAIDENNRNFLNLEP